MLPAYDQEYILYNLYFFTREKEKPLKWVG